MGCASILVDKNKYRFIFFSTDLCKTLTVGQKAASSSSLSLASPEAAPWMGLRRTARQTREGINNLSGTDPAL